MMDWIEYSINPVSLGLLFFPKFGKIGMDAKRITRLTDDHPHNTPQALSDRLRDMLPGMQPCPVLRDDAGDAEYLNQGRQELQVRKRKRKMATERLLSPSLSLSWASM